MGLNLKNIDWKKFSLWEFIAGCGEYYLMDYNNNPEKIAPIAKYRLNICEGCKMNIGNRCDNSGDITITNVETKEEVIGCGCNLNCKPLRKKSECPAGLWKAVIS